MIPRNNDEFFKIKSIRLQKKNEAGFSIIELLVTVILISTCLIYIQRALDDTTILHMYGTVYEEAVTKLRLAAMETTGKIRGFKKIAKKFSTKKIKLNIYLASRKNNLLEIAFEATVKLGLKKRVIKLKKYSFYSSMKPQHSENSTGEDSPRPLENESIGEGFDPELNDENL